MFPYFGKLQSFRKAWNLWDTLYSKPGEYTVCFKEPLLSEVKELEQGPLKELCEGGPYITML